MTWIVVVLFALLGIGVLVLIVRTLRKRLPKPQPDNLAKLAIRDRIHPDDRKLFRVALWISAFAALYLLLMPDTSSAERDSAKSHRITLDLRDCPPAGDDTHPVIAFIVAIGADGRPMQSTCVRIKQRPYKARPRSSNQPRQ